MTMWRGKAELMGVGLTAYIPTSATVRLSLRWGTRHGGIGIDGFGEDGEGRLCGDGFGFEFGGWLRVLQDVEDGLVEAVAGFESVYGSGDVADDDVDA
jgi:hypothetical protein